MEIVLAQPRGFCAGVVRAVNIVEMALECYGPPIYVYHEIVHNPHVVNDLRHKGAVFIDNLADVPAGAVTIFSAHGVADRVVEEAKQKRLEVIDATCPLVTKVHLQAQKYSSAGYELIIIGHAGHEEVQGTMGSVPGPVHVTANPTDVDSLMVKDPERLAYVTQTTLSVDDTRDVIAALQRRFPNIQGPNTDDICYATQNRQNAVRQLCETVDLLFVVGARNSSNSNRLREVCEQYGTHAHLIQDENEIQPNWLDQVYKVGITAGASTPEILVEKVIARVNEISTASVRTMDGVTEKTIFSLPKALVERKSKLPA